MATCFQSNMGYVPFTESNMARPMADQVRWQTSHCRPWSIPTSTPAAPTSNPGQVQHSASPASYPRPSPSQDASPSPISPPKIHSSSSSPSHPQMFHHGHMPKSADFSFSHGWPNHNTQLSVLTDINAQLDDLMSVYSETPSSLYSAECFDYAVDFTSSARPALPNAQMLHMQMSASPRSQMPISFSYQSRQPFQSSLPTHTIHNQNYMGLQRRPSPQVQLQTAPATAPPPPPPQTAIDALMATLDSTQSSSSSTTPAPSSSGSPSSSSPTAGSTTSLQIGPNGKPKRHICPLSECAKAFAQPTHLKIHLRSHTGEKPYLCSVPTCGATFSQLGNLRTHERRHRGEKPRRRPKPQHATIQEESGDDDFFNFNGEGPLPVSSSAKQYECRLDSCRNYGDPEQGTTGKVFTQLGNLKAHMNKFHKETLAKLSQLFAMEAMGLVEPQQNYSAGAMGALGLGLTYQEEEELKVYFRSLYKNCNKGIKGRGKGRRVAVVL